MEEMIAFSATNHAPEHETLEDGGKRQRLECESEIGQQQLGTKNVVANSRFLCS